MSCVMSTIDDSQSRMSFFISDQDLRLDRHVERRRRLVGDQQRRVGESAIAIITRCRMPPENWCG